METIYPICDNCNGYGTMQTRQLGPGTTRTGFKGLPCPVCGGGGRMIPRPVKEPLSPSSIPPDEGTAAVPSPAPEPAPSPFQGKKK